MGAETTTGQATDAAPSTKAEPTATAVVTDELPPLSASAPESLDTYVYLGDQGEGAGEGVVKSELQELEKTNKGVIEPPKEPAAEPVQEQPAVIEDQPKTEPVATTTDPEKEKILPNRINTAQFDAVEQEAIALGKQLKDAGHEVPPLKERIEIVELRKAREAQADQAARQAAAQPPQPSEVDKLTTELEEVEAVIRKATEEEAPFNAELSQAVAKQATLTAKLELAKAQEQQAQAASDIEFNRVRTESKQEAETLYPDAAQPNSELGRAVQAEIAALKVPGHPDHDTLFAANAPLLVTQRAATSLAKAHAKAQGITVPEAMARLMGQAPAAPAAKPVQPTTRKVQPASGAATEAPKPPAPDGSELLNKPYDPEAYDAWMDQSMGTRGVVLAR